LFNIQLLYLMQQASEKDFKIKEGANALGLAFVYG
jgi:hypothetical protein